MSVKSWVMARMCGCAVIDCRWCARPWVPPEKRSKAELIEELAEYEAINRDLRGRLVLAHKVLSGQVRAGEPQE